MTYEETYEAVRAGVSDAMSGASENVATRRLMPIASFDAVDEEGVKVRVVGIVEGDDVDLNFICLMEVEGELFPTVRESVFQPTVGKASC